MCAGRKKSPHFVSPDGRADSHGSLRKATEGCGRLPAPCRCPLRPSSIGPITPSLHPANQLRRHACHARGTDEARICHASFLGKTELVTLSRQFSPLCVRARTHHLSCIKNHTSFACRAEAWQFFFGARPLDHRFFLLMLTAWNRFRT